jgi:hypothetical protein
MRRASTEAGLRALKQGWQRRRRGGCMRRRRCVDGFNSGIGGGCFMMIRLSNGSIASPSMGERRRLRRGSRYIHQDEES